MTDEKIKLQARQARFLRDPIPIRLANLASNLARLKSFAAHPTMSDAARRVVHESKHFIEWTATDATLAVQVELLAVQRQLAQWQIVWSATWNDEERRQSIASCADRWAQQFLASSGLLQNSSN